MTVETAERTSTNGTQPEEHLPVDTFLDAAPFLRRPFTPNAVKFKVQATFPKVNPTGALVVGYIDARLVVDRFNKVCPQLWFDEYEAAGSGLLLCRLTVDGITRSDVGQGAGKGLYSDALKRAAVKFGVGVSLYAIPKMLLKKSDGHLKDGHDDKLLLTDAGDKRCRTLYSEWLAAHGVAMFGQPFDHGDVEGSVGDPVEQAEQFEEEAPALTRNQLVALKNAAKGLHVNQIKTALTTRGINHGPNAGRIFLHVPAESVEDLCDWLMAVER